jgi:superfamily I DNA/RNA helicase
MFGRGLRSQRHTWAKQLIPLLAERNIILEDVNWVEDVLEEPEVRRGLALIHLALRRDDSLAWWTILADVSKGFLDYVYDEAAAAQQSFGQALLRLYPEFPGAPTPQSAKTVAKLMASTLSVVDTIQIEGAKLDESGWGGWVIRQLNPAQLSPHALRLFQQAGQNVPVSAGLGYFLGQLEPLGKDLAAQSDAVRLMSMTASKGLTVNTCIIMGVEQGLIPLPMAQIEEERRLLYVAMTRATDMCVLTWAQRCTGQTAYHGKPNVYKTRSRCTLLEDLPIGRWRDGQNVLQELERQG